MTTLDRNLSDRLKLAKADRTIFSNGKEESKPTECDKACIIVPPTIVSGDRKKLERNAKKKSSNQSVSPKAS